MDAEEQKMWEFIEAYLQERPPVYWAAWWGRCQDEMARKRVESVLFQNGGLRDLTDSEVKQAVLDAIRHEPAMMQLVIADLAEEVARLEKKDRVAKPKLGERIGDWKLHVPTESNCITDYKCGLVAGQRVRLKKDLVVTSCGGVPTGTIHPCGEEWTVLKGIITDPVLWFLQPDGERCTWSDDAAEVEEWFEKI